MGSETPDYLRQDWLPYFDPELVLPDYAVVPKVKDQFPVKPWLEARAGAIKDYVDPETNEPTWLIIQGAANTHQVSRFLLIMTLQRENSLIKAAELSPFKMARACGQAIFEPRPADPPEVQKRRAEITARNKGFRNQVYGAAKTYAKRFAEWKPGSGIKCNYKNGEDPMTVDDDSWDIRVPRNAATWALLRYTPQDFASRISRDIWRGYFGLK